MADAIRIQLHDCPLAVVEALRLLSAGLEETFRSETGNAMALRTGLLRGQRMDGARNDVERPDRTASGRHRAVLTRDSNAASARPLCGRLAIEYPRPRRAPPSRSCRSRCIGKDFRPAHNESRARLDSDCARAATPPKSKIPACRFRTAGSHFRGICSAKR